MNQVISDIVEEKIIKKIQNQRWNEFLTKNKEYMEEVESYIQESKIQSQQTRNLAYVSLFIAVFSVFLGIVNTFLSWWKPSKKKQHENRWFYRIVLSGMFIFLAFVVYMFFLIR